MSASFLPVSTSSAPARERSSSVYAAAVVGTAAAGAAVCPVTGSGTGAEGMAGRLKWTAQRLRQEPLEGIKIKPRWDKWPPDSTYTDSQGTFVVVRKGGALEWKSDTFYYAPLIVEDTAGVYYKDTVYIKMVQIKEGDGWYRGEFESKDAKITMRK